MPFLKQMEYDDFQKAILKAEGNIILCTGRQVGKTTIFAHKAADYLLQHPDCQIIVVSLTEDQAKLIIIMILSYLEKNHRKEIKKKKNETNSGRITLRNKSRVISRPVGNTGDAVRGFTADILIIDEASRMPKMMWAAAKPTLATTAGKIWMCSTPFGKQGYFYECWLNKNKRYTVFHVNTPEVYENRKWENPERKKEALKFLEEEHRDMSELEYGQEYLGLFLDDLRQFFSDEVIDRTCTLTKPEVISIHHQFFLGCDIARMGGDMGTWEVIQKTQNDILLHVENFTKTKIPTTFTFDKILEMHKLYNFKKIGIDAGAGSLGVGVLDFLLRESSIKRRVVALNNKQIVLDDDKKRKRMLLKEDMHISMLSLMEMNRLKLLNEPDVRISLASVQYQYMGEEGEKPKIRIFGKDTHIVEGLTRAVHLAKEIHLNLWASYTNHG